MTWKTCFAVLGAICCFSPLAQPQQSAAKTQTLRGTVQQVNAVTKQISVLNEPVPGGMGSMTMSYSVKDAILLRLKAGDHITASMSEGDMTLYDIQVLPPAATPAEPASAGLRLEDLERMALTGNPTLAQVQANVRMMAANARQAGLYPNPTVGYYGDEIRGGYSGGGKQGGFISQTIVTGGKLRAARRVGELLTGEAETQAEAQRLRILNNVRSQFYHVLAAQRLVDVRQKLARLSADATRTSHQLANIGQADRPDILQAEVEEQQVRVSFRTAQRSLQSAWRGLAAVAGQADFPQTRLAEDLEAVPDLNYEEWRATTLRDSPEVKLAAQGVERADALLLQAKRAVVPDFRLYGNLSQNNQPLMDTSPRIAGVKWRCPDRRAAACFQSQPGQYCRREGRY